MLNNVPKEGLQGISTHNVLGGNGSRAYRLQRKLHALKICCQYIAHSPTQRPLSAHHCVLVGHIFLRKATLRPRGYLWIDSHALFL